MGGPEEPVYRWHEPTPSPGRVLLLGTAAAGLLALAVVSLVVENWDVGIIAGVLGLAAAADLWRDLRPRAFVLAAVDGLVVSVRGRTTVVAWSEVADLRTEERRFGLHRSLLQRTDGTFVRLPRDVPLDQLERRRPGAATA